MYFILIGAYHNGKWPFYRNNVTRHVIKNRKPKVKEITHTKVKRVAKKVFVHPNKSKLPGSLSTNQAQTKVNNFWNDVNNAMKNNHGNYEDSLNKEFNGQRFHYSWIQLFNRIVKLKPR